LGDVVDFEFTGNYGCEVSDFTEIRVFEHLLLKGKLEL
jgi:hypothetical protein